MTASGSFAPFFPSTSCRTDGVVVTLLGPGRVTAATVAKIMTDAEAFAAAQWLIDASATMDYEAAAIPIGTAGLRRLRAAGLRRVVVIVTSSIVRMGASVVALSSAVPFVFVGARTEANAALAEVIP